MSESTPRPIRGSKVTGMSGEARIIWATLGTVGWMGLVAIVAALFVFSLVVFGGNTGDGKGLEGWNPFMQRVLTGFAIIGLAGIPAGVAICWRKPRTMLLISAAVLFFAGIVMMAWSA